MATSPWACARWPTAWPGARWAWCWPGAAPGPSRTSACCASSRTPASPSTGWRAAAWGRSSRRRTQRASTAPTLEEICYAEFVRRRPFSDYRPSAYSLARGAADPRGPRPVATGRTPFSRACRGSCPSSASTSSAARDRCTAAEASSRPPWRRAVCPCSSLRWRSTTGALLVDGGVLDNMPTDLLVERDEGPVVAVTIGSGSDGRARPGRPRVPRPGGDPACAR